MTTHTASSEPKEIKGPTLQCPQSTLDELFTEQAAINSTSIAFEFENKQVTYSELNKTIDTIVDLFVEQVNKKPDEIPVVYK